MKKILLSTLAILALTFNSCSKDDVTTIDTSKKRLTKITAISNKEDIDIKFIYSYSENGFVKSIDLYLRNKLFQKYEYFYDSEKRLIKENDWKRGNPRVIDYNYENGRITSSFFLDKYRKTDEKGNEIIVTDSVNTVYTYDKDGVLTKIDKVSPNSFFGSSTKVFSYNKQEKKLTSRYLNEDGSSQDSYYEFIFGDKKSAYVDVFPKAYRAIYSNELDLGFNIHTFLDGNILSVKENYMKYNNELDEKQLVVRETLMKYESFNAQEKPTKASTDKFDIEYFYE